MAMLTVEKITTREAFAALETPWNELLEASASNTIALTHEWLLTWWDVFHEDRELCLLLVRDGAQLVGIAPLLKRKVRHLGILPFKRLEFLATGEDEFDEICSDYLDFIVLLGRETETIGAVITFLVETERDWDEMLLTDVAGEAANLPVLQASASRNGLGWQTTREQICIYLPFTTDDALMDGLRGPYYKNISKDRRKAQNNPERVRVQMIETAAEFEAGFEILMRLHQDRWIARGKPGSFASEKFTRFHRQVAAPLLQRGWLKLWVLWIDGEPNCALYDFFYARKIFYYQSGLGNESRFLRSPGLFLRFAGMEAALQAGYTECDFLKGAPDSYKFNWGGQTRPIVQVRLARQGAKELLYRKLQRAVEAIRPLKRRIQGALKRTSDNSKPAPAATEN